MQHVRSWDSVAHVNTERSERGAGIPRTKKDWGALFLIRKSPTQPCMSQEATINFRVIINSGRLVCTCIYMFAFMSVSVFCWFRDPVIATIKIQYGFCYRKCLAQISSVLPHLLIPLQIYNKHGQKKALQEGFLLVIITRREGLWVWQIFCLFLYKNGINYRHFCSL